MGKSSLKIVSSEDAKAIGLIKYYTGGLCTACNVIKAKKYRHANREKHNAAKRRYSRTHIANILLASAKRRAKYVGVPFEIELSDIEIPEVCPALGIPLQVGPGKIHPNSPTLDRIRPELGYVKGNIAVLSHRANLIKNDATAKELESVAGWLRTKAS